MIGNNLAKLSGVLLLTLWTSTSIIHAQMVPPDPFAALNSWSFENTFYVSDDGPEVPLSYTNINVVPGFDGNALQVDTNVPAWLRYKIHESDGTTNLTFSTGSIEMWFSPDWTNGAGPNDWGTLIEAGELATNSPSDWWSLYFDPAGTNIFFSSETNGVYSNYLSYPISWTTSAWHHVALTYSPTGSVLYVDGVFATNGGGMFYTPSTHSFTNGFSIGSDYTGTNQLRALIDDVVTFGYVRKLQQITNDYGDGLAIMNGTILDTGNNSGLGSTIIDYGSNLWVSVIGISNSLTGLLVSNTSPDIMYEVQGIHDLTTAPGGWTSLGFIYGSELTNWTPAVTSASKQTNLFVRIRSWVDTTGTGIPDWWWLTYFGQTTNVDAYTSATGDNYSNLQKFQMGLNPTNFYEPDALSSFGGCLDASGTNAFLEWNPLPGSVSYVIQRGIRDTNDDYVFTQIATLSSNAYYFEDTGAISNDNAQLNIYNIQAIYPGSGTIATNS